MNYVYYGQELYHHGILGMKWGVRRYQNADGSLTAAGKERYGKSETTKSQKGETARKIKNAASKTVRVAAVAGSIMMLSNAILKEDTGTVSTGKRQVDSYLKTNGQKKVSTLDTDKTWADYAWEEVTK